MRLIRSDDVTCESYQQQDEPAYYKNIEFTKEQTQKKSDRYGELAVGVTFELVEKYM